MFIYHKIRTLISDLQSQKKHITIQNMANDMGILKKSLDDYKEGRTIPSVDKLEKIAVYFKKDMNYFFDQPGWNNYDMKINLPEQVSESNEIYQQTSSSRNPWELLYETQRELMEVKVENERLKNVCAPVKDAKVG